MIFSQLASKCADWSFEPQPDVDKMNHPMPSNDDDSYRPELIITLDVLSINPAMSPFIRRRIDTAWTREFDRSRDAFGTIMAIKRIDQAMSTWKSI